MVHVKSTLFTGEVFQQILEELRIPFVYALHDADRDVAAVANVLSAFVVSKDSDFYVLPLKHGYISLNDLAWQQVLYGVYCSSTVLTKTMLGTSFFCTAK